jgi:hypothetical protein
MKDLGRLLYHLFAFNHKDSAFYEEMNRALGQADRTHHQSGQHLIHGTAFLTKLGVYNFDLLGEIFQTANDSTQLRRATSSEGLTFASFEVARRLVLPPTRASRDDISTKSKLQKSGLLYRNALVQLAEMDYNLEVFRPDGGGSETPRLHEDLRAKMIKLINLDSTLTKYEELRLKESCCQRSHITAFQTNF